MRKIEIFAPAGNKEKMLVALDSGADAIFLGGRMLNLRAGTENFSDADLKEAVEIIHSRDKKIYVNLNAVPHNEDIIELPEYVQYLESIKVDGVIVSDMGVFQCVREFSKLPVTIQTHSSNTNYLSIKMWKNLGVDKIVLDRDISLENLLEIRAKVPEIKIEVFVHGPINLAISGRTLMSNYMEARNLDRNPLGENYFLVEETRPGEYMPVYEDKYGTYIFGARDLCTIDMIDKLFDLGIDSIKIDGGMRDVEYLRTVLSVYKEAVEDYSKGEFTVKNEWIERLKTTSPAPFVNWFVDKFANKNEIIEK